MKCGPWESKPVEIPQLVYTLLPSKLTQDMARTIIMAHGRWWHFFFHRSTEKVCFCIEAGNYTKSTSSPSWQTRMSALPGDGKLFWFIWQKEMTPMSPCLSARLPAIVKVGGVLYCVLPPWGNWQEVSSTWEKPIYSTRTICLLTNIVGFIVSLFLKCDNYEFDIFRHWCFCWIAVS